jgi:peptide/nickel transport system ATP-binding protein
MSDNKNDVLLDIRDLHTHFSTQDGVVKAVDGVSIQVNKGEVVGLVGESGCGKSVTSLSILRLVGYPGKIVSGEILFEGRDILKMTNQEITALRGDRISMIFQQPTSCLNPVFDAGFQLGEVGEIHQGLKRKASRERAVELLRMVGIPDPERRINSYPHELSGGMAQRVMIAMALATSPELLIADEPTTALDVTIQAQILDLMRNLHENTNTSIILITHDLGVVAEMAQRVVTMYAGQFVEEAETRTLFKQPKHPYTVGVNRFYPGFGDR